MHGDAFPSDIGCPSNDINWHRHCRARVAINQRRTSPQSAIIATTINSNKHHVRSRTNVCTHAHTHTHTHTRRRPPHHRRPPQPLQQQQERHPFSGKDTLWRQKRSQRTKERRNEVNEVNERSQRTNEERSQRTKFESSKFESSKFEVRSSKFEVQRRFTSLIVPLLCCGVEVRCGVVVDDNAVAAIAAAGVGVGVGVVAAGDDDE